MEGLYLLVHNLSHSDMVLEVDQRASLKAISANSALETNSQTSLHIARPKFSHYRKVSEQIYDSVESRESSGNPCDVTYFHPFSRATETYDEASSIPVGFNLHGDGNGNSNSVRLSDRAALRFNSSSASGTSSKGSGSSSSSDSDGSNGSSNETSSDDFSVYYVHFPLIAVLLPKWLKSLEERSGDQRYKKKLVLVSGRGTPSDSNASATDNSTKFLAKMISLFIRKVYPEIEVKILHSSR
jgi:hypothetical protein